MLTIYEDRGINVMLTCWYGFEAFIPVECHTSPQKFAALLMLHECKSS